MSNCRILGASIALLATISTACAADAPLTRKAEAEAIPTAAHPYAGFWKKDDCSDRFGIAISPAGKDKYSVSFCGPGGCFEPGTYRPDTTLVGDRAYRIIDKDTIELSSLMGYSKYVRCPRR